MTQASLHLHDVRLSMHIGHTAEERMVRQPMRVDLDIAFDTPPDAFSDDRLSSGFCYDKLLHTVKQFCDKNEFNLIEHCAKRIYDVLKAELGMRHRVAVSVTKCQPPITFLHGGAKSQYGDKLNVDFGAGQ